MKQKSLVLLFGILSSATLSALANPVNNPPGIQGLDTGYLESKDGFYVEVNGGAVFFNGPSKDTSNIYLGEAFDNGPITGHPAPSFSTDDTTGSVGGTFGYVLDRKPTDSWMGTNLRVEVGGDYFQTSNNATVGIDTTPDESYLSVGRLDGQNGSFVGPLITDAFSVDPFGTVKFTDNNEIYDISAVIKSDYSLAGGAFVVTPKLGFSYAHIDQRFSTDVSGIFDVEEIASENTFSNQREVVDTDYYGAVFGLELKANVSKEFIAFLDTTTTLGVASSSYSGNQSYSNNFEEGGGVLSDGVSDNSTDFSAREQVDGGFYYDFGPVILKVSGGFDYWGTVATVREASPAVGTGLLTGQNIAPSHLGMTSMVNPEANVSVIVPF